MANSTTTERSGYICKFNLVSSREEQHALHLRVHVDLFHSLIGEREESSSVVTIERCSENKPRTGSARLFAIVEKTHLEFGSRGSGSEPSNKYQNVPGRVPNNNLAHTINHANAKLHCSERFLAHYNFNTTDYVIVRPVHVFPLEKVVVAVTSAQALKWTQNTFFSTGLLLSVCQHTVLVRQDDVLLAPYSVLFSYDDTFDMGIFFDMKVLACEPMNQGRLTVNTEVVVINQTDREEHILHLPSNHCERGVHKGGLVVKEARCQPLILSDFAVGSSENEFIQTMPAQTLTHSTQGIDGTPRFRTSPTHLEPVVIMSLDEMCSILDVRTKGFEDDIPNTVGVSWSTLCDIGLFDGSLAEIELDVPQCPENPTQNGEQLKQEVKGQGRERSKSKTRRTVRVHVAKGDIVRDGEVYLPPGLCFNIYRKTLRQSSPSSTTTKLALKKSPLSEEKVSLGAGDDLSTSWSWRGTLPYAGEVHLSVINSPNYSASTDTTEILKQYFTIPRLLKKGDVIAVSSRLDADYSGVDMYDGGGPRHPVIYFRVARVHPALPTIHTYWVDIKHSVLFQDGAVNSYIPATMAMVLEGDGVLPPPGMASQFCELVDIIRPHLHHGRREDDPVPSVLLIGQAGCGKALLTRAAAAALHLHLYQVNAHELCGDTSASTEARVKAMMTRATTYAPCILHLRNVHVFGKAADGSTEEPRTASAFHEIVRKQLIDHNKWPVVIVASTTHAQQVNLDLYEGFLHQQTVQVPSELERQKMLTGILKSLSSIGQVNLPRVAQRTAGFVLGDLYALICQAYRHAQTRLFKYCSAGRQTGLSCMEEEDLVLAGVTVTQADFETALDNLQSAHSDSIGAPKIPQVSWDDVGGLVSVKAEILDTIQLPLQHPELLAAGLRRSGVLLYGPPGTGKTLLAKAVATECSLNFLSVKGPELINMYVGQSEENIREVFQRARSAAPCVIFFDELDSLAPNRGRSGDSGGVMDRVVSQLLAELDGMNKSADVFVIGATNRPDLLDPALLRPGRFDKLLYLGVSEDRANQLNILKALTRKFELSPGWTLERVVEQCPLNMTGADFYALCSDAMLNALKRKIALLSEGVDVDQSRVEVEEDDFRDALATLVPSVSMSELARYQSLQHSFSK